MDFWESVQLVFSLVVTGLPVVVLFPLVITPFFDIHVVSVSFVLPPGIAIVLRRGLSGGGRWRGLRLTTRHKQGNSQSGCKQKRSEVS
jgi:hypothetical protein